MFLNNQILKLNLLPLLHRVIVLRRSQPLIERKLRRPWQDPVKSGWVRRRKGEKVPLPGGAGRKEEVEVYTTNTGAPNLCWKPLQ